LGGAAGSTTVMMPVSVALVWLLAVAVEQCGATGVCSGEECAADDARSSSGSDSWQWSERLPPRAATEFGLFSAWSITTRALSSDAEYYVAESAVEPGRRCGARPSWPCCPG
jgi:hypothetical protein